MIRARQATAAELALFPGLPEFSRDRDREPFVFVAERNGEIAGIVTAVLQAEGTGFLFAPHVVGGNDVLGVEDSLITAAIELLADRRAWTAQAIVDPHASGAVFERNGVSRLTELQFFEATPELSTSERNAISFSSDREEEFLAVLRETYRGTLDCPEVVSRRDARMALDGHRMAGVDFDGAWTLHSEAETRGGILLLSDQPEDDSVELTYLGVIPVLRNRGLGKRMIKFAKHVCAMRDRAKLSVACDVRNQPAMQLYLSEGFKMTERKKLFALFFSD